MLALRDARQQQQQYIPNVLPCRIHHNGPTKITKRLWSPTTEADGSKASYFRGRKLRGRTIRLPSAYYGVLAKSTEKHVPQAVLNPRDSTFDDGDEDLVESEEEEVPEPVKIMDTVSTFDEIVVWGHDQLPAADDTFVRGVEEWMAFAEAIHGSPASSTDPASNHKTEKENSS